MKSNTPTFAIALVMAIRRKKIVVRFWYINALLLLRGLRKTSVLFLLSRLRFFLLCVIAKLV